MLGIAAGGGLVGALLAPTLMRRLSPRLVLIGENWMLALSLPWLLVVHNALLLGVIVAAAELITPVTNSIVVSYRVALAPDRLQGRVQAASTLISFSGRVAGAAVDRRAALARGLDRDRAHAQRLGADPRRVRYRLAGVSQPAHDGGARGEHGRAIPRRGLT